MITVSVLYALGLLAYLLLRETLWQTWWGEVAVNFAPWLFVPLLVLVPLAVLVRSWPLRGATAVAVMVFLVLYGDRFLPRRPPAIPPDAARFTIMTFNVHVRNNDPDRVAAAIEREAPDIVALQELRPAMAEALSARLADRYPYRLLQPEQGFRGSGVLSRYPIREEKAPVLAGGVRVSQHLVLDVAGQPLELFNVHLHIPEPPPAEERSVLEEIAPGPASLTRQDLELNTLMDQIGQLSGPLIVVGDFNLTDQSPGYAQLTTLLRDAYREAGWGFGLTFPNARRVQGFYIPFPLLQLDYVFHSPDLQASRAWVGRDGGSDHRYLVVELSR